jgi:manganese transport protein
LIRVILPPTLAAVISLMYFLELFLAEPDWNQVGWHVLVPSLPNGQAVLIAVGMLGATVMPHVIYLHSQLVQCRNGAHSVAEKKHHLRMERIDIILAMNIAFVVNAAMVVVSAAVFHRHGMAVNTIEQAHRSLEPLLGPLSSGAFGIALLASGFSSSAVGTMAGQTIMNGFVNLQIPLNWRRLITIAPAVAIIVSGINPMRALIFSQVTLSFTLPLAIIPMILINNRADLMGAFANKPFTKMLAWIITGVIITMNALLVGLTLTGNI